MRATPASDGTAQQCEEREQLIARFAKARHYARQHLAHALEGREGSAGRVGIGRIDDPAEVVADLRERSLRTL